MKETSGRRENDPDLLIIIIRSARRNNNIFGIHHPPQRNVLFIPCWSRRSPILWLSTSGYGWPFAVWLLSSRGSAFHQRHLWDCEHVPQKKKQSKSLGFDRIYVWEKEKKKESMRENDRIIRKKCGLAQTSPKKWTSNDVKKKKMSIFSINHIYKYIIEQVIKLEGASFRSKPYRFGIQNGDYVVLETEWSSFINPWTKKLEFVVGQHRILKGPANPDIFRVSCTTEHSQLTNISEEVLKEAKIIQEEIRTLLDEVCLFYGNLCWTSLYR